MTYNIGPPALTTPGPITDAVAALFDKIGPAVLLTHSAGGSFGWLTAIKSQNVKAIVSYETGAYVFPDGEVPPPIVTPTGTTAGTPVSPDDFEKLTKIPIQLVFGDNIPTETNPNPGLDGFYRAFAMAALFVDAVNRHGGDASILHLPDIGVFGNTHFAFADLNNLQIAGLLSDYLHEKGLDKREASRRSDAAAAYLRSQPR
jgi:pimeloyl-ACP methyl ester carboxylesterase